MGEYNPYAPRIVGQEWVPIRDEDITFGIGVNAREVGHAFTVSTPRFLSEGRFYIKEIPTLGQQTTQTYMVSVYPRGTESLSGPIRSVIIPCNNGGASGTGGATPGPAGGALTFADGVADPSDGKYVSGIWGGNLSGKVEAFFATNQYSQLLTGKRIVAVNLLYVVAGVAGGTDRFLNLFREQGGGAYTYIANIANGATGSVYYGNTTAGTLTLGDSNNIEVFQPIVQRMPLGEVDPFWSTSSVVLTPERLPYTYESLQRFEISHPSRRSIVFASLASTTTTFQAKFHYLALEVLYCEEQRVAYGATAFGEPSGTTPDVRYRPYVSGVNSVTMRTPARALNPLLTAGEYVVTLSAADTGVEYDFEIPSYPILNGLRELYQIPSHPAVQVNLPFPRDPGIVGQVFTKETTHVIPQISLHTSGGPLPEVNVYGRQVVAPVYGSIYAEAEINDDVVPSPGTTYPWVRFYARRWGNTTQRLILTNQAVTGQSVYITPPEWDALPQIIDNWKEITLRFDTPPTIVTSGSDPKWRWTSSSETAGNRWEVLGVTAHALSGVPGNLMNAVPASYQLGSATYGGTNADLVWQTTIPPVSGVAEDVDADGVFMFSQAFAAPTGVGVMVFSQPVSGIGRGSCGVDPCCIPTAISYHRVGWSSVAGVVCDPFNNQTAASGWGNADVGGTWISTGGPAADYYSQNGSAYHSLSSVNTSHYSTIGTGILDSDITMDFVIPVVATGGDIQVSVISRYVDINNQYMTTAFFHTNGTYDIAIRLNSGGVFSTLVSSAVLGNYQANNRFKMRMATVGSTLRAKIWLYDNSEPENWQIVATNSTITTASGVGVNSYLSSANTNTLPVVIAYDNFLVTPWGWGYYELQRSDTVDTDWATIMKATSPCVTGYSDFEARVGILSSYRVRAVDVYGFEGTWSSTVTSTIPEPGVTIGCTGGHLLIFTSNSAQDGSYNLAYSSIWEGQVEENFVFPEAVEVQLQKMYGRDFVVAFRPLERGGERFSRTVLVQAAAISPPTLGDFRGLRDMAWADLPYVCVRDEDGNRWFATVLVPGGVVRRSRQLYMAPIDVIEVTDTPAEVDPS
jgi:hypothetical protein